LTKFFYGIIMENVKRQTETKQKSKELEIMTYYLNDLDLENIRLDERRKFLELQRKSRRRKLESKRKKRLARYTRLAGIIVMTSAILLSFSGILDTVNGKTDITAIVIIFIIGFMLAIGKFEPRKKKTA